MRSFNYVLTSSSLLLALSLVTLSGHSSPESRRSPERGKGSPPSSTSWRPSNYYDIYDLELPLPPESHGHGDDEGVSTESAQVLEKSPLEAATTIKSLPFGIPLNLTSSNNTTTSGSPTNVTEDTGSHPPEAAVENETEIPSFSEWTKLQLERRPEVRKTNNITRVDGKNFASPDCGAKVLSANPEAQNPSGFLSSSHDEYMLNRCGVSIFFTVELCEPMRIEKIAMGNLELFSSSPRSFDVMLSDRYPSRDWTRFGPFQAPESRNVHNFVMPPNTTFAKYLKIQINDHWGNEHYCPLTTLKVYGKSEYEAITEPESVPDDHEGSEPVEGNAVNEEMLERPLDVVQNTDSVPPESQIPIPPTPETRPSVFNSTFGAIKDLVKKVLRGKTDTSQTSGNKCISMVQCVPESPSKGVIESHLSCHSPLLEDILGWSSWCGWDYCHGLFSQFSIGSPQQLEGLLSSVYGVDILPAACHQHLPLKVCSPVQGLLNFSEPANKSQVSEAPIQDSPAEPTVSPAENVIAPPPTTPSPPLPEQAQLVGDPEEVPSVRESVIVRLTNRIRTLERNQSLSSGYLEELSRRFKKQSEESSGINESFRKGFNSTGAKLKYLEDLVSSLERNLKRSLVTIRERVVDLELQRGILFFFVLLQFIGFSVYIIRFKRKLSSKMSVFEVQIAQLMLTRSESHLSALNRKRSLGESLLPDLEASKPKKKKKRRPNNNNNLTTFNFQPPNGPNLSNSAPIINIMEKNGSTDSLAPSSNASTATLPVKKVQERLEESPDPVNERESSVENSYTAADGKKNKNRFRFLQIFDKK